MNTQNKNNTHKKGFTLIELLVVIAIIAILAAVVFGSLTVMRDRGRAAKIVGDMRVIRDALQFRYSDVTQYPIEEDLETEYPGLTAGAISIQDMIDEGVFNGKFTSIADAGVGDGVYYYDADSGDGGVPYPISSCGSYTNNEFGVNLVVNNAIALHPEIVAELDNLVDASDGLDCGRIRRATASDNSLLYNISVLPTQFP